MKYQVSPLTASDNLVRNYNPQQKHQADLGLWQGGIV